MRERNREEEEEERKDSKRTEIHCYGKLYIILLDGGNAAQSKHSVQRDEEIAGPRMINPAFEIQNRCFLMHAKRSTH